MLHSRFSRAAFGSQFVLFIAIPATSYQHSISHSTIVNDAGTISASFTGNQILLNKNAVKFVRHYIRRNHQDLKKIRQRSSLAFKTMDRIFKKYDLPPELKYLAVVESQLKATAVSCVGAAGPWQLMPATAKVLGLKITPTTDERTQYNKSTKAAALYLRDLYTEFGDWLLVMAAYNCGPRPVHTAIRKSGSRNFWNLQAYLPGESRNHVKKFIATHYYFEGQGSVTTLTKAEHQEYTSRMMALSVHQKENRMYKEAINGKELVDAEKSIAYGY